MADLSQYLCEDLYVDFSQPNLRSRSDSLFSGLADPASQVQAAFYFVRDTISHSFDCQAQIITARASEVLQYQTGICHAKANLLAALLRPLGIPVGFCFQRLTLVDDDSAGYAVHAFNAVHLNGRWMLVDARGNKDGIHTEFSTDSSSLAYPVCRAQYQEYFWHGIHPAPHPATMRTLETARSLEDVLARMPDSIHDMGDFPHLDCWQEIAG